MRAKVLKPFPYSDDGLRVVKLAPGDVLDISEDIAIGLMVEGFIDECAAASSLHMSAGDDAQLKRSQRRKHAGLREERNQADTASAGVVDADAEGK